MDKEKEKPRHAEGPAIDDLVLENLNNLILSDRLIRFKRFVREALIQFPDLQPRGGKFTKVAGRLRKLQESFSIVLDHFTDEQNHITPKEITQLQESIQGLHLLYTRDWLLDSATTANSLGYFTDGIVELLQPYLDEPDPQKMRNNLLKRVLNQRELANALAGIMHEEKDPALWLSRLTEEQKEALQHVLSAELNDAADRMNASERLLLWTASQHYGLLENIAQYSSTGQNIIEAVAVFKAERESVRELARKRLVAEISFSESRPPAWKKAVESFKNTTGWQSEMLRTARVLKNSPFDMDFFTPMLDGYSHDAAREPTAHFYARLHNFMSELEEFPDNGENPEVHWQDPTTHQIVESKLMHFLTGDKNADGRSPATEQSWEGLGELYRLIYRSYFIGYNEAGLNSDAYMKLFNARKSLNSLTFMESKYQRRWSEVKESYVTLLTNLYEGHRQPLMAPNDVPDEIQSNLTKEKIESREE